MNKSILNSLAGKLICIIVSMLSLHASGQTVDMSKIARKIYHSTHFPGMIQVDSNLYADNGEVSNIDYREYLFWTRMVFGNNKVAECLPDTLVWSSEAGMDLMELYYLRGPWYAYLPVVGISYQQAQAYARWRSDRVFEYMLIKAGVFDVSVPDSTNYFSIEKYFSGKYNGIKPDYSIPYPVYSIPTIEEWTLLCKKAKEINSANLKKSKRKIPTDLISIDSLLVRSKENFYYKITDNSIPEIGLNKTFIGYTTMFYNLQGNVSELSATEGISLGGSWKNTLDEIMSSEIFYYTGPNAWTGFRCVCRWEFYQGDKIGE